MTEIAYSFPGLDQAASGTQSTAAQVASLQADLTAKMQTLAAVWSSQAAAPAQQAAQAQWTAANQSINDLLGMRGARLASSGQNMSAAEQKSATLFT